MKAMTVLLGAGCALTLVGPAYASEFPLLGSSLPLNEPSNALSLTTWIIHVSSVVEWIFVYLKRITAMALVWQYGEESGNESWKGLSGHGTPPWWSILCMHAARGISFKTLRLLTSGGSSSCIDSHG
ncbi:uncharacterized protein LOC130792812 isoform X1 [Actinidia eriantha]|uniref:uncharacterized protein LOC130792812 isoform X1 n=1 Tax=Actinidia eriantha TaxID=165200 RepID=UPI00258509B9|nr:uncharacterized protein LOC130792812 isoform X1 [Actinidia eriantha]XP_057510360.1 uncharacterized protein LOC130792812 isoform X1 [Actinidia eriantha]